MHVIARNPHVVRDETPTTYSINAAVAANLCERERILQDLPDDQRTDALALMTDYPTLQLKESLIVTEIAKDCATRIYDTPLDALPHDQKARLLTAAAVLYRSQFASWVDYATDQAGMAVEGLGKHDLGPAARQLSDAHWYGFGMRTASAALAAYRNVLASLSGMNPGTYLRIQDRIARETQP